MRRAQSKARGQGQDRGRLRYRDWVGALALWLRAVVAVALVGLLSCQRDQRAPAATITAPNVSAAAPVSILAWWDLPKADARSHELSGIAWDASRNTLYAVPDKTPQIVELVPDSTFHNWHFGNIIPVHVPGPWDAEGLAVTREGFVLSNEFGPQVYAVLPSGAWRATLPLPPHFQHCRTNLALEALTVTDDQHYLFTANEQALTTDGAPATRQSGTVIRILRHDQLTGADTEFAYRTDPLFLGQGTGELGVVELAALSAADLLVMERSYVPGAGNSVRIYRVHTEGAPDVLKVASLDPGVAVLPKTLLVDLSTLPDQSFPAAPRPQPSRLLANFEGMALGPRTASGQRLLFLISDDNSNATQVARLVVLAFSVIR